MKILNKIHRTIQNALEHLPVDNKLVVAFFAYLLTTVVTKVGLDLDGIVFPGITVGQVIAIAAAGAAGWLQPNEATVMRRADAEDGNPDPALIEQYGLDESAERDPAERPDPLALDPLSPLPPEEEDAAP